MKDAKVLVAEIEAGTALNLGRGDCSFVSDKHPYPRRAARPRVRESWLFLHDGRLVKRRTAWK